MEPEAHGKILSREETRNCVHVCSYQGCEKVFSRPNRLIIHLRTHTGEKPYVCEVKDCGKRYARSAHLKRHQDTAHLGTNNDAFAKCCPENGCGLKFTNNQHLQRHISRKHESAVYKCTFKGCEKSFGKHQQLKVHEFDHTNVNPFLCPFEGCELRFRVPSKLKRHMKVHAGYICEEDGCTKTFPTWTQLRKHKAFDHSQEFKCSECGKIFKQKQWLRQHRKIHLETRQMYTCPRENCGRSYLDQRNLKAHIRSYHDGRRFSCQHTGCDRKFVTEQKLKDHQMLHESNKPPPKKRHKKVKAKQKTKKVAAKLLGIDPETLNDIHTTSESEIDISASISESEDTAKSVMVDRSVIYGDKELCKNASSDTCMSAWTSADKAENSNDCSTTEYIGVEKTEAECKITRTGDFIAHEKPKELLDVAGNASPEQIVQGQSCMTINSGSNCVLVSGSSNNDHSCHKESLHGVMPLGLVEQRISG